MSKWKHILAALLVGVGLLGRPMAALEVGERAPEFSLQAAMAGKAFDFSLKQALARGPVVLYFFPAAFSEGCSIEARAFAEAIDRFEALNATVIGVSGDDMDVLTRFSVKSCNGKFAVASDASQAVMKAYDAVLQTRPEYANRVSYVIAPAGTIVYSYRNLNPDKHVERMLAAVRDWKQQRGN